MAKEAKDAEVVLEDEGVVTVDISDDPSLAEDEPGKKGVKAAEGGDDEGTEKKSLPRVRLTEKEKKPAVDEAATALKEAQTRAEEANRGKAAAEATANAERQRREQAERVAAARTQEADDARSTVETAQLAIIDNGIEAAQRESAALEAQLASAYEAGDFKGAASIQTKLSKATASQDRLEAEKDALASAPKRPEGRVVEQPAPLQEQYLSQFAPEAQTWLRSHPECIPAQYGGNATSNAKMMQGHYAALAQNLTPNTPAYFQLIEEHTGHREATSKAADVKLAGDEDVEDEKPALKPKQKVQPSAPVSRDPPSAQGLPRHSRTVVLSKEQQEMAKISFPQLKPQEAFAQYARNLVELEAEGKMGRLTH